jgi:hypothetical protein
MLFQRVTRQEPEAQYSVLSTVESNKAWKFISSPPYLFVPWCLFTGTASVLSYSMLRISIGVVLPFINCRADSNRQMPFVCNKEHLEEGNDNL